MFTELKALQSELKQSTSSAFATGTNKNLKTQWHTFLIFCIYFNFAYLPASTKTIRLFAQFLSRSFKSVQSIRNYISGIRTMHALLGCGFDHINEYLLNLSLKGLSRLKPHRIKRAEPMTISILYAIHDVLDFSNDDDIVYWCCMIWAFFMLARKSNLVPTTKGDIIKRRFLSIKDVKFCKDFILVHVNFSKTIQFGEREIICPLIRLPNSKICPVSAFENLLTLNLKYHHGALFTLKSG